MFLKDFLKHFAGAQDTYWINVHSVDKLGRTFTIRTTEEVDETSEKLVSLKEDLEGEMQWRKELQKEVEDKDREIIELENTLSKFNDGVSVKDVVDENNSLKDQIRDWRKNILDLEAKIEKLNKRKNKATIMRRDVSTGQLIAEYEGVEYILTKKQ